MIFSSQKNLKKKIINSIRLTLLLLLIFPVLNIYLNINNDDFKFRRATLFNMDAVLKPLQKMVYPHGISLNANQVVIGKNGWLFLGDEYAFTISNRRAGSSELSSESTKKLNMGLQKWQAYFASQGVEAFHVILGPDKATIYPEYLPDWAKPSKTSYIDVLVDNTVSNILFDPRDTLLKAKKETQHELYYKTDTHWNNLGAMIVYESFLRYIMVEQNLDANWIDQKATRKATNSIIEGGDLAGFLHLKEHLEDESPEVEIFNSNKVDVSIYNHNSGELISKNNNTSIYNVNNPILLVNENSKIDKKVLWLRDSFGTAMSKYMAATFSETLQVHYDRLNTGSLSALAENFKPDYVFVTLVERKIKQFPFGTQYLPK